MPNVLVLTGSSRPSGAGDKILPLIVSEIESREGFKVEAVDIKTLNLPFFNGTISPSTEGFAPEDENAKVWTKMVAGADAVVLLTPEYNGSLSAIQKNAIDWVSKEWVDKPVSLVGYGWGGGVRAHDNARIALATVKANVLDSPATLRFMKDINMDGSVIDEVSVEAQLKETIDKVVDTLSK